MHPQWSITKQHTRSQRHMVGSAKQATTTDDTWRWPQINKPTIEHHPLPPAVLVVRSAGHQLVWLGMASRLPPNSTLDWYCCSCAKGHRCIHGLPRVSLCYSAPRWLLCPRRALCAAELLWSIPDAFMHLFMRIAANNRVEHNIVREFQIQNNWIIHSGESPWSWSAKWISIPPLSECSCRAQNMMLSRPSTESPRVIHTLLPISRGLCQLNFVDPQQLFLVQLCLLLLLLQSSLSGNKRPTTVLLLLLQHLITIMVPWEASLFTFQFSCPEIIYAKNGILSLSPLLCDCINVWLKNDPHNTQCPTDR